MFLIFGFQKSVLLKYLHIMPYNGCCIFINFLLFKDCLFNWYCSIFILSFASLCKHREADETSLCVIIIDDLYLKTTFPCIMLNRRWYNYKKVTGP